MRRKQVADLAQEIKRKMSHGMFGMVEKKIKG